jgi:hypothetical protein
MRSDKFVSQAKEFVAAQASLAEKERAEKEALERKFREARVKIQPDVEHRFFLIEWVRKFLKDEIFLAGSDYDSIYMCDEYISVQLESDSFFDSRRVNIPYCVFTDVKLRQKFAKAFRAGLIRA